MFNDAFEHLNVHVYDLKWYTLKPKAQRIMLQIMMIVSRLKLLNAGLSHHALNYEHLRCMLQRVFSHGIVINDIVKKT